MAGTVAHSYRLDSKIVDAASNSRRLDSYKSMLRPSTICFVGLVYNPCMLNFLLQLIAIYLFAATPCFAGWIANGGKREDIGIPILSSVVLACIFILMVFFFA